jgi:hypothetical protein
MKLFQTASALTVVTSPARDHGVLPKIGAAAVWGAVGLSLTYWAFTLWGNPKAQVIPPIPERPVSIDSQRVARALGAATGPVAPASVQSQARHALIGLATDSAGRGVALIRTDDAPVRSYRGGATLPDGMVLRTLGPREAGLAASAQGPVSVRLALPSLSRSNR